MRRAWARDHADDARSIISRPIIEALRWSLDPKNRAAAVAILVDKLKLPRDIAEKSLALMAEPGFGFARDAKFDMAGFKNVLALRAEVEGGTARRSAALYRSQLLRSRHEAGEQGVTMPATYPEEAKNFRLHRPRRLGGLGRRQPGAGA